MTDPTGHRWVGRVLHLQGTVTAPAAEAWRRDLLAMVDEDEGDVLDLGELDLDDGPAVVEAVNLIRGLLARWGRLTVVEAPQMLAHTLYKVGDLGPRLRLVRPRVEEGTTAG